MIFLSLLIQAAAVPPEPPEVAAYMRCVADNTRRLIPSGETAEAIAIAATFNCSSGLEAAGRALDKASNAAVRARGFNYPSNLDDSFKAAEKIQAMARDMSITAVVESRLKMRATK